MVTDGAQPNTKTFTALIGSFGKPGSVAAELEVIEQLLSHEPGGVGSAATYAALMAACEKAGQGDLALALFEKMAAQARPYMHAFGLHDQPAVLAKVESTFCGNSRAVAALETAGRLVVLGCERRDFNEPRCM